MVKQILKGAYLIFMSVPFFILQAQPNPEVTSVHAEKLFNTKSRVYPDALGFA